MQSDFMRWTCFRTSMELQNAYDLRCFTADDPAGALQASEREIDIGQILCIVRTGQTRAFTTPDHFVHLGKMGHN